MSLSQLPQNHQNFQSYLEFTQRLVEAGKSSGAEQSEANIAYTKLNYQRMQRIAKTQAIASDIQHTLQNIRRKLDWWVITETWCGDAAQSLPIIARLAELNSNITLKIILRDEHPEWMNRYLTNGSRAIPKLVLMDALSGEEYGVWGPRPAEAQKIAVELTQKGLDKETKGLTIQKWYNEDKGLSIQNELNALLQRIP
ncbi:MAG: thioredoxin family protein [Bacteroidia bacterium]|jgi:hypothetical protein|nr:thioredoxin family protein [Bacteroidia bacterium]